jgi:pimeloyl-ACP methyl ester carboxylesterase
VTAPDGLRLHIRSYGSSVASALPVVCLPALARTAADFHPLAAALAADPAKPRLVLALDYRGHGQSTYDRNPNNYTIRVALADLSAVLAALEGRVSVVWHHFGWSWAKVRVVGYQHFVLVGHLAHTDLPDRLRHALALRDQNIHLPQLRDDLFGLVALPCHYSPP